MDVRILMRIERELERLDHDGQKRVLAWMNEKVARGAITSSKIVTRKAGTSPQPSSTAAPAAGDSPPAEPTEPTPAAEPPAS